jgi:hypothetical protein
MKSIRPLLTLALTTSLTFAACTKTEQPTTQEGSIKLLSEPLLTKLPPSTAGFSVIDFSSNAYKLLQASPFGNASRGALSLDNLVEAAQENGADEDQVARLKKGFNSLVTIGVLSPEGRYTPEKVVSRVALFAAPSNTDQTPVTAGIFASAAPGIDLSERTTILSSLLKDAGFKITPEKVGSVDGFVAQLDDNPIQLHIAANKTTFGAALNTADLEGLFSSNNTQTLQQLQGLPEFKSATAKLDKGDDTVAFAFASVARFQPVLENLAKLGENGDSFDPKTIPVTAFAAQTAFGKQYVSQANFTVSPRTESQTKIMTALEGSSISPQASKLPADTAVAIALDAKAIGKLDSLLQSLQQGQEGSEALSQVKKLQGVTIGIRNNTSGSPLPDIYLSIDSANREEMAKFLESSVGMAMALTGQNTSWLSKEVGGAPTRYFTTMIGVGVYLSSPKNSQALLLGTSEGVIKDLLATQEGKSPAFTATLPKPLQAQLSASNLVSLYFNFKQVGDVVDSVKGSLAMFTGGNAELNSSLDAAKIRALGIGVGGISYTAGVVSLQSTFELPPAQ